MFSVMCLIYHKSGVDESLSSVLFLYYLCLTLRLPSPITSAVLYSTIGEKFDAMCTAQNTSLLVLCLLLFLVVKKNLDQSMLLLSLVAVRLELTFNCYI